VTGPGHYQRAERLAADAQSVDAAIFASRDDEVRTAMHFQAGRITALAQVHATLALAAATALGGITLTLPQDSGLAAEWNDAIGVTW
jgi:hypothetical protein